MKRLVSVCMAWVLVLSLAPAAPAVVRESGSGAAAAVGSPVPATLSATGMVSAAALPDKDFDSLADAGNTDPQGIWSDGTTMWVADSVDGMVYAYDHATREHDGDRDFESSDLDVGNTEPYGIWSDEITLWVVDGDADNPKIYAYDLLTKVRVASEDFDSLQAAGNAVPTGLWANSTTMWVADENDAKVYAYNRSTRERDIDKDINTLRDNLHTSPTGLWSDGTTIWVSDVADFDRTGAKTAYAYDLTSGRRRPGHDATFPDFGWRLAGLWSDGTTLWAASSWREKIYATTLPEPPGEPTGLTAQSGDGQITLSWTGVADADSGSSSIVGYDVRYWRPQRPGLWHTVLRGDSAAVAETVTGLVNGTVYRFEVRARNSEASSEWVSADPVFATDYIPPHGAPGAPSNLVAGPGDANMTVSWAAPTDTGDSAINGYEVRYRRAASSATAWTTHDSAVVGMTTVIDGLMNIQPYDVQVRAANDEGSGPWVTATAGALSINGVAIGMWSDGSILYIGDSTARKAYAYDLATSARASQSDIVFERENSAIRAFWGDDETLYVLDWFDGIYAYNRISGEREPEFDYVGVSSPPRGQGQFDGWVPEDIYSDGETMWVLDFWTDKVYAYGAKSRLPRPDLNLDVAAGDAVYSSMWSDGETLWLGGRKKNTNRFVVHAFNLRTKSRDADLDNTIFENYVLGMWSDGATMWSLHNHQGYLIDASPLERRPAPVPSLSAEVGDTELWLQWSNPDDGPADPTYEVEYREDSPTGAWTAVARSDTAARAETVTGLTNGAYYGLRVRAVSDSGHAGRWTTATGSPAPAGAPDTPQNLAVDGVTETADEGGADRALSVQWDPPSGPPAATYTYEARYRADRSTPQPWTTLTVTGTSERIAGLDAGTRYEVQVRAVNAGVAGPWATASNRAGRGFYALPPSPGGIWSDGDIMWVSDPRNRRILAFDMATKERIPERDFHGLEEKLISQPSSLWSDGEKMWVVNDTFFTSRRVASFDMEPSRYGRYVETVFSEYDPQTGSSLLDRAGNAWPNGIWGEGSTLWIADSDDTKAYAYHIVTGARKPDQDFDDMVEPRYEDFAARSQVWPGGMWTDGTTMWVVDELTDRIYAYRMSDKQRNPLRDIEFDVEVELEDVWSSGDGTLWVADAWTDSITPRVLPDPPGALPGLNASPGDASVTVRWSVPGHRGSSDITGYTVRYFDADDMQGTISTVSRADPEALSEEITGLTNGKTYRVQVRAHNSETHNDWESVDAVPAESSDATLSDLAVSLSDNSSVDLSFNSDTVAYTAGVGNSVDEVMVTPTAADEEATVTVDGMKVESGNPETVALDVGVNVIRVVVEAQDGTTRGYTVTVTREASGVATLSGLVISDGVLDPAFDPGAFGYVVDVGNLVDEVTVTSTVAHDDATVTVNETPVTSGGGHTVSLDVGVNVIRVVVEAQDGTTTEEYTVTVDRAQSSDATLSGLVISEGVLSPRFASGTVAYTAGVVNSVDSVTVTPTVSEGKATVTVTVDTGATVNRSGSDYTVRDLDVGSNVITIVVRAQDGTTQTYTVTVTRAESEDATLSDLVISEGVLSPRFGSGTRDYTASVLNSVDSVTVTPTVSEGKATVTVTVDTGATVNRSGSDYTFDLDVGSNVITIVVRAQDGTTRRYRVTVDRAVSSDAALSGLTISGGSLSPGFGSGTRDYTASVLNSVDSVTVTPTVNHGGATVTVNGDAWTSGGRSVSLVVGSNVITIEVTAQDGTTIWIYRVTVTRAADSNAGLSGLTISSGVSSPVVLSPGFGPGEFAYTAMVVNSVESVMVTPTVANSATVTVDGTDVESGNPETVALDVGVNVIRVVVEAQDGTTRGYTVTVTREASGVATLSGLVISDGVLDPAFDPGAFGYVVDVGNLVDEVTVTSTVAHDDATVTVNETPVTSGGGHTVSLDVGVNVIRVVVEAQDGTTTEEYTVTVTRAESSDATLSGLVISPGVLSPSFDPVDLAYTAGVDNVVTSVRVTPTANHGDATVTVTVDTGATVNRSGSDYTVRDLDVGSNVITIVVRAQDGTTRRYRVTVDRAESSDAALSGLDISEGVLSPRFGSGTRDYTASVLNSVDSVTVTPTANHGGATVTVTVDTGATVNRSGSDYTFDLDVGSNVITIVVRAQDGTTRGYTVTVDRAESSDAALSGLDISGGSLSPGFASGTRDYTASVLNSVDSVTVTPTVSEDNATVTVTVDGASVPPSGSDHVVSLDVGSNVITIEVTAQDGTTRRYRVTVTRAADSNAGLSGLTISSGVSSPVVLSPGFASGKFAYTAMVVNSVESVMVTPTVANSATVTVDGTDVESGNPETVALDVGVNVIRVVVTAQDGLATQTYTVRVTRAGSSDATLSDLHISEGVLSTVFDPVDLAYTAMVVNSVESVMVTPTANHGGATITVNGSTVASGSAQGVSLAVGDNVITIVVTAQDGAIRRYTVTVDRAVSSDATLSGLTISGSSLSPGFASSTVDYTARVVNSATSVTVTPTVSEGEATVTVTVDTGATVNRSGSDYTVRDLDVGSNVITIEVTAQDGTTQSYTVTVTRAGSSDATLSDLDISGGSLSPGFGSGTRDYTASVLNSVDSVTVTPTANHGGATVTVTVDTGATVNRSGSDYTFDLDVGSNVITIVVRAQDGTTRGYTVTVDRAESSDAALSGLDISGGSLSPGFASGTRDYTASVLNSVDSVTVTPEAREDNATVTVNGDAWTSGGRSVSLVVGSNVITIEVRAQDGTTIRIYRVTVTRAADSNAGLSGLAVSSSAAGSVDLSPVFGPGKFAYTAMVDNEVTAVMVTPTVANSATVTVNGGAATSGGRSVSLVVGSNVITIVVTAQDGLATRTYTVRVTRAGFSDATLSGLDISPGRLSPSFASGTGSYTLMVGNLVDSVTVTPTANHGGATVTVTVVTGATVNRSGSDYTFDLDVGSNVIIIEVTAEDGAIRGYTVTVDRAVSSDAALSGLTISGSSLSPRFASSTVDYTARVVNSATSVTVTPTVSEGEATVTVTVDTGATVNRSGSDYTFDLDVGSNLITIEVTAEDFTTQTYTVTVTRTGSEDATLSGLTISEGLLSPTFDVGRDTYTARVGNLVDSVTVTPTVSEDNATVTVTVDGASVPPSGSDHVVSLDVGSNVIRVVVTAQDGTTTRTYTVTVTRAESSDATLNGLAISPGPLSPTFASGTDAYTVSVVCVDTSVMVTPTANHEEAMITVDGTLVTSGVGHLVSVPHLGSNVITIVVTARDGTTTETYTVTVTRAGETTGLKELAISPGGLSPVFNPGTCAYTVSVPNSVDSVTVTTVSDVTLTVTVTTVNDAMVAVTVTVPVDNPALVAARDSSHYTVRDLDVGFNTIDIAVGGIRAYTITIDRAGTTGTGTGTGTGGGSNGGGSGSSGGGSSGGGGGGLDVGVATFVVANGWSAADVGVASVLSARVDGAVVVYTAGDVLSAATAELLREALPAEIVIVGGTAAVSFDVRAQMRAASPESGISRVTGEDRVATAAGAARRILGDPAQAGRVTLVVANGWSPPDVGAAAALAARSGRSAVVYTRHDRLPEASAALLGDYDVARVILVGGTAAISAGVHDAIVAGTGASVSRLTGADRVDTAAQAARRVLGSPAGAPEGVTLVIANGWSPPDVGVAAALAAATENSAVAYTSQAALPAATAALIRDYRPAQIIIVGGTAAVANDVRQAITDTASADASVRRITGSTRTDTAARAARRILADS